MALTTLNIAKPFLQRYLEYTDCSTDACPSYSTAMALLLLGHALGYNSVNYIQPGEVHHNLYVLLVGSSTISRKTTSQTLAKKCYPSYYAMPNQSSPEAFISELSENPNRIYWMGEFTILLKQISQGNYNAPMVEIFNDLYDCPESYNRKLMKRKKEKTDFKVEKPYLSACSTVTPEMIRQYLNEEMVYGGFLVRWLLVNGEPPVNPRPRGRLTQDYRVITEDINKALRITHQTCFDSGVVFEFTDEALDTYNRVLNEMITQYSGLSAFCGRYSDILVKIADILYISDALTPITDYVFNDRVERATRMWDIISLTYENSLTGLTDYTYLTDYILITKEHYRGEPAYERLLTLNKNPTLLKDHIGEKNPQNTIAFVPSTYIERAYTILKPCLDYAASLANFVTFDRPVAKLRDFLENNSPVSRSVAMVNTHLNSKDFVLAEETLSQMELIRTFRIRISKQRTNVTKTIYCHTKNFNTVKCLSCPYKPVCWNENPAGVSSVAQGKATPVKT